MRIPFLKLSGPRFPMNREVAKIASSNLQGFA
jgi:hypothetical protein